MFFILNIFTKLTQPHKTVVKEDNRNLSRLFSAISLFFIIVIIPVNIPYYFNTIHSQGISKIISFIFQSVIIEESFFIIVYLISRGKHFRFAGILINIVTLISILLLVSFAPGPFTHSLLIFLTIPSIIGIIALPLRWQLIQLSGLIFTILMVPSFITWIPPERISNDVLFQIILISSIAIFIGQFINHQEKTRLNTIENLNKKLNKRITDTIALLKNMNEGVVFIDQNNKINLINNVVKKLLKIEQIELQKPEEIIHIYNENKEKLLPEKIFPTHGEYQLNAFLKNKDSEFIPVSIKYSVLIQNSQRLGSIMIIHDMRKELEIEKTKDNLFSVISHELRTPLTKIRWGLDIIKPDLDQEKQQNIQVIDQSIDKIAQIINIMLIYSNVSSGSTVNKPEKINLETFLNELEKKHLSKAQEKGLTLNIEKPTKNIIADKKFLNLILDQYLSNAIKFTEKGSITLNVKNTTISITDTGKGIVKDDQSKIFSSHYQKGGIFDRDQEKGGIGTGLSLVKLLADKGNMTVGFESKENKGSTFFVTIKEDPNNSPSN